MMVLPSVASAQGVVLPTDKVAKLALVVGQKDRVTPEMAKYFELAGDAENMPCKEVIARDQAGKIRWVLDVRRKIGSSRIDMILIEPLGDRDAQEKYEGKYYLITCPGGKLLRACHKSYGRPPKEIPREKAESRFQELKADLLRWERGYKRTQTPR